MEEKVLRSWRFTEAEPHGLMMWFDPATEDPSLRDLPRGGQSANLDKPISVSASEDEDEDLASMVNYSQLVLPLDELPF